MAKRQLHQFVHVAGFGLQVAASRKKNAHSLRGIIGEMMRQPGHCPHVATPRKPVQVYGTDPAALLTWIEEQHATQRLRGRRLRKDAWVALVG
ncbi:hypothetical protein [Belnapia moabensis]|uniref:hypothetical protein n=1 Tax=Belnapia moabensis TaxID=365533 RepID=UPI0005BB341D|nr:hypothetical protein [Belnapia moabensis]